MLCGGLFLGKSLHPTENKNNNNNDNNKHINIKIVSNIKKINLVKPKLVFCFCSNPIKEI